MFADQLACKCDKKCVNSCKKKTSGTCPVNLAKIESNQSYEYWKERQIEAEIEEQGKRN